MVRRRLVAADATMLRMHDHSVWCGSGQRELHDVAVAVFRNAINDGDRMLFIGEQPRREWLSGLGDVDRLVDEGALELLRAEDVYAHPAEPADQRAEFEAVLERALADGYSGLRVVADSTRFAAGAEKEFRAWLEWEAMADHMQAVGRISGMCWFDTRHVSTERLTDLAAMHPVRSEDVSRPNFQIFCDSDQLRAFGEMDALDSDSVRRVVGSAVTSTGLDLDISDLDFIDHAGLRTLDEIARSGPAVRLHGASTLIHRVWDLLDLPTPALEFC